MVNVSCVQMDPTLADFEANLSKMERFIREIMAVRSETDLIVFPELITSGYECTKEEFAALAERTNSGAGSLGRIGALCKQYDVHVVYGFPEVDSDHPNRYYNAMVMIGADGNVLGSYRKVHPFDTEKKWCLAGDKIQVLDTPFGKVGMMICWDTAFPEVARAYALQGAQLLVVATNWEVPYDDDWDLITRARAFDNTLHLVSANRIGFDKSLGFFGHSNIISPRGKVITSLDEAREGIIHASLDLRMTDKLREEYYTFFKDRRPRCYAELVKE